MPNRQLKPCPFCGRAGELQETEDHLGRLWPVIRCATGCGAEVVANACPTEAEAIAVWNTRAEPKP
jgi:Lar family restriction alleviation protein